MKGLEASEVKFSGYQKTYRLRLDSEYYSKEFMSNERYLNSYHRIRDFCVSKIETIKNKRITESFDYLEISNVSSQSLNYSTVKIDQCDIPDRATYLLQNNDVVVSTVRPNRNAVALIYNADRLVGTSGFAVLRTKNEKISPYYLYVFCKTKFFVTKLMRENTASMYPAVSDYDVFDIRIPMFSKRTHTVIEKQVIDALKNLADAKQLYVDAEELLLSSLGTAARSDSNGTSVSSLANAAGCCSSVNVKSFSESFGKTARLDAEYYQPKYENDNAVIKKYGNGSDTLQNICHIKDDNFEPKDDTEYDYIELADVGNVGEIIGSTRALGQNLPTRARRLVHKGDVIVSSIEGSLGSCALISTRYDNAMCSTGFYVVSSDKINSETLLVLFKSNLMQQLLKQSCSGTILTSINKTDFQRLPIPLIALDVQRQISSLLDKSFRLRQESVELLNIVKQAVEIAIEQGEKKAFVFLDRDTEKKKG